MVDTRTHTSTHDHTRAGDCRTCHIYRPDVQPRTPNYPPVCDGDRTLMDRHLIDVANLHHRLVNPDRPDVDRRRYERFGVRYNDDGTRETVSLGESWADPLAPLNGVGPTRSRSNQGIVSGSRDQPTPAPVDAIDLTATAREPNPTKAGRRHPEDQIGHMSVATLLDQWVRAWRDTLFPDHHLPPTTVDELTAWLRNRLPEACDHDPTIGDFAVEIRNLRSALRSATGETEPRPEPCEGVACGGCDLRALFRRPGDTYRAECGNCGRLYTEPEYHDLAGQSAADERAERTPEEIHDLLRHN